jgi:uncharacterized membrane protein YhaH (DUF805 family)
MPDAEAQDSFRFLYRQTDGVIDRATWARASIGPLGIAFALTLIAWVVAPNQPRDLGSQPFFSLGLVLAHAYLIFYGFALFVCAVAEYFVSAKRFRDRGRPAELAGLAPFALLLAAAAHWYQPRSEGSMPEWATTVFDVVALAVILWTVAELAFGAERTLKS